MFDVGFNELLLLAIIALVVLGPEKLPHAARMTGAWIGRIRRMIVSVQADIENEVAAAEMRERIKKELEKAKASTGLPEAQTALEHALQDTPPVKPDVTPTEKP